MTAVSGLVRDLYRIVDQLEHLFPGRHFTPDGHLVGSLGEVLACERYGLEILEASGVVRRDDRASEFRLVGWSSSPLSPGLQVQ